MRKFMYVAFAAVAVVGGCAAVSHLGALQAQQAPQSPPLTIPENVAVATPAFQRGIDVDAYTFRGQDFSAAAAKDVAYAKYLHANALSISFPFFMKNRRSTTVFGTIRTPTTTELALFAADAERAGLYVSFRPLLSEFQIGGNRTTWQPVDLSAWFASYQRFLLPYAQIAQENKVGMFIVGAEFSKFGRSPLWNGLDRALAKVFHGRLAYSSNGPGDLTRATGGRQADKAVDAYPALSGPSQRAWEAYDRKVPRGAVLTEVGIPAFNGAWRTPWKQRLPGQRFDPRVQVDWFLAACQAAQATRLGGIYFWNLPLSTKLPLTRWDHPGAWAYSVGAAAISRCFGRAK
jgi:hypothetical protein